VLSFSVPAPSPPPAYLLTLDQLCFLAGAQADVTTVFTETATGNGITNLETFSACSTSKEASVVRLLLPANGTTINVTVSNSASGVGVITGAGLVKLQ